MENKRNRRLGRAESQSPDEKGNLSETSIVQGNATSTEVSENAENVFDRNLGSELTEPSQISNEIEVISQRITAQNNTKMTQIEKQLNIKFEEILKEIRNYIITTDEKDAENSQQGPPISKNKGLRNKRASNTTIDRDKNQDYRLYPSEMSELRQPCTPLGIANGTLDETVLINENGREADHHTHYNQTLVTVTYSASFQLFI